jgi:hypothetical protein
VGGKGEREREPIRNENPKRKREKKKKKEFFFVRTKGHADECAICTCQELRCEVACTAKMAFAFARSACPVPGGATLMAL